MKGNVQVGGGAPVSIQSMLKITTQDVDRCIDEIAALAKIGCDIIRVSVKKEEDASAAGRIADSVEMPVVADIHLRPKLAIAALDAGVDAIRINPGNIRNKKDLSAIISRARERGAAIRIGVNSGSVRKRGKSKAAADDREREIRVLMVELLSEHVRHFEQNSFENLVLSAKCSSAAETIRVYRDISATFDYPLHVGVTAAGPAPEGIVRNSVTIGTLLAEGIGDTIRVSLTGPAEMEVLVGREILRSLEIKSVRGHGINIVACPTCGRTQGDLISIVSELRKNIQGVTKNLVVGVMGCEVNGPGEAAECDIALVLGAGNGTLYINGRKSETGIEPERFLPVLISAINETNPESGN
jgi:(E)-4-hydroxy-3-methylbut-2-enyl-diphosphate synthase